MFSRLANSADINAILELQAQNLKDKLPEEQHAGGFVTTPFTDAQLELLMAEDGVFVTEVESSVIAYLLAGSWQFYSEWPIFRYMVTRFPLAVAGKNNITAENSFQYGPICIAKPFRGSGVFPSLFECMRLTFRHRYPYGYTFINRINQRSYIAHTRKLGLQLIDQFDFNGQSYYGLAFDTHIPTAGTSSPTITDGSNEVISV